MAANSRESRRRRRILDQGSDRLAFITGRTQTLPPPSPSLSSPPLPSHPHPDPDPDADADAGSSSQPHPLISNDPNSTLATVSPHGEAEEESDSSFLAHDTVTDLNHSDAYKSRSQTPSLHDKHEAENEIQSVPTSEVEHVQPPPPVSSLDVSGTEQQSQQPQTEEPKTFIIPREISSAINGSRGTRLCCSVAVALLVVASYLGFSLLGSKLIKSLISFRPLYLVLVTNLTVVVARLLYGKQRGFDERSKRRENKATSDDGDQWGTQLARTLELGMVMQNVVDAVFMDCAIYAIIVVCGLSLVHT